MKQGKTRSQVSISSSKSENAKGNLQQVKEDMYVPPLDEFTVNIFNLRLTEEDRKHYAIKVVFFDQLLIFNTIKPISAKEVIKETAILKGTMNYDPSDYEKMCLFANNPLIVQIQALANIEGSYESLSALGQSQSRSTTITHSSSTIKPVAEISCCNIDILPLFIERDDMLIKKRMEPMIKPSVFNRKSWDNLPLITMKISVSRNPENAHHHEVLKAANYMKLTLIASYNMIIPFDEECVYTVASKIPLNNEMNTGIVTFNQGTSSPRKFKSISFYPKWESQRIGDDVFTKGDEKFICELRDIQNEDNIDLEYYLKMMPWYSITTWGSFHRTLMLLQSEEWMYNHIRQFKWPLEVHIYGEERGYSFMAFLDLFPLLYPGEHTLRCAVPLRWVNANEMLEQCGCELLLTPNEKAPSTISQKHSKGTGESAPASTSEQFFPHSTGSDCNNAFVIVEVRFGRPLKKIVIPPYISQQEMTEMLNEMERQLPNKRECTGRGQVDRDWQATVLSASNSLRRVPYQTLTDMCTFNRQLSETRTRVELTTSFWNEAAIYVNNNFVVQEFLGNSFEEMLMMSHACLMRSAYAALFGEDRVQTLRPSIRAARNARQLQDIEHATDLYLQLVVENPYNANSWRELAVCLRDVDRDWADVCMNKAVALNPRHPLTLLCKGCWLSEEDPEAAEKFFVALLALYPFWSVGWIIANAYYLERQLFNMADQIWIRLKKCIAASLNKEWKDHPRAWEYELGEWWEQTPLLPGVSLYYDAADLLLRLRAIKMADVCVSRALCEDGESVVYYHILALCCRLRGALTDALCHVQTGIKKFGDISYLRSLEAECLHKLKDCTAAMAAFEKSGSCIGAFSILLSLPSRDPDHVRSALVEVVRRQPSAYAWMALAIHWMSRAAIDEGGDAGKTEEQRSAIANAEACAVCALKCDRRASRAWALLAEIANTQARRAHCAKMATACGYEWPRERIETKPSELSVCHRVGVTLRECRCEDMLHL